MTDKDSAQLEKGLASAAEAEVATHSSKARQALRGTLEWLTRRVALATAKGNEAPRDTESIQRAKAAIALAERGIDPANPLREGYSGALALSLYREASYWLLRAIHGAPFSEPSLSSAFAESSPSLLARAAADEGTLSDLHASIVQRSFVETGAADAEQQNREALAARSFVAALLLAAEGPSADVAKLLRQRYTRLSAFVLAAALLLVGVVWGVERARRTPDLAIGKPWITSSSYAACTPAEHTCAGSQTDILFHTLEESSPWFQIDLGGPTSFSRVKLTNRSDCCTNRAFPVAVEVSSDASSWQEVARRTTAYERWTAKFPTVVARYVRVRALKKTYLHLERVQVHPR